MGKHITPNQPSAPRPADAVVTKVGRKTTL